MLAQQLAALEGIESHTNCGSIINWLELGEPELGIPLSYGDSGASENVFRNKVSFGASSLRIAVKTGKIGFSFSGLAELASRFAHMS